MSNHYDDLTSTIDRLQADRRDLLIWLNENTEEMDAALVGLHDVCLSWRPPAEAPAAAAAPKPTPTRGARRCVFLSLYRDGSQTKKSLRDALNLTIAQVSSVVSIGRDAGHMYPPNTLHPDLVVLTNRGLEEAHWFSQNGKILRRKAEPEAKAQ